jgi:hypothetical protein
MRQAFLVISLLGAVFVIVVGLSSCATDSTSTGTTPPAQTVIAHSPTPTPPLVPTNSTGITLTMKDSGRQVILKTGQTILLALDTLNYDHWTIRVADTAVLTPVTNATLPPNTQGLYKASKPGQTMLTASGDLKCLKGNPPCQIDPQDFRVQVTVQ